MKKSLAALKIQASLEEKLMQKYAKNLMKNSWRHALSCFCFVFKNDNLSYKFVKNVYKYNGDSL